MKYPFLLCAFLFISAHNSFSQQVIVDFFTNKYENPISEVSKHFGVTISVFGYVRTIKTTFDKRIIVIGKMGDPEDVPKYPTQLQVIIFKRDMYKFKNIKDSDLVRNTATITGKVMHYKGNVALRLQNLADLDFVNIHDAPTIR